MHDPARPAPWTSTGAADYGELAAGLRALFEGEPDPLANLANAVAAVFHTLPGLNWAGVYLLRGEDLVLGPFQGRPACVRIPLGRGVCGTAAAERRTILVPDVAAFPGHIACDPASRAELVVPLVAERGPVGVLDLDSPQPGRFAPADGVGCEGIADLIAPFAAALAR